MADDTEVAVPTEEQKRDEEEYSDFHVFYHSTMNYLADRVFVNNDEHIGLRFAPDDLSAQCVVPAPLWQYTLRCFDDHLDDLVTPLLGVLFGHDH